MAIYVLTFFNKIQNPMLQVYVLTLLSFIYYKVRSFLEIDAMTKAPYLANEYMIKSEILEKEEIGKIMNSYKEINSIGIKMVNLQFFAKCIAKIIIYCVICLI